eukprot:m.197422 g.197422  ORF g.197422 m.197422 type:complete len:1058 (+) comp17664_c2_seq1:243-3416(+)
MTSPASTGSGDVRRAADKDPLQVVIWTLDYESLHFDSLKILMERFVNPLRQHGLAKEDELEEIFPFIDEVFAVSEQTLNGFRSVASAPDRIKALCDVFTPRMLQSFRAYCDAYPNAERAMAKCLQKNDRFGAFLNVQQRTANATLDRLMRHPLERFDAYCDILKRTFTSTPRDHPCFAELSAKTAEWEAAQRALNENRLQRENEEKLSRIEMSFPWDELDLLGRGEPPATEERVAATKAKRRLSAPNALLKFAAQEAFGAKKSPATKKLSGPAYSQEAAGPITAAPNRQVLKEGRLGCVKGGKATDDLSKRFLFLLTDLLIIGKPRSNTTYSLKSLFRLGSSWIQATLPAGSEGSDVSFVVGGPHERDLLLVASTPKEKDEWVKAISSAIAAMKQDDPASSGIVKVFPSIPELPADSVSAIETLSISNTTTVDDLINMSLKSFKFSAFRVEDFALWELNRFGVEPLQGWENPLCIYNVGQNIGMHSDVCQFVLTKAKTADLTVDALPAALRCIAGDTSPRSSRKPIATPEERKGMFKSRVLFRRSGELTPSGKSTSAISQSSAASTSSVKPTEATSPTSSASAAVAAKTKGVLYGIPLTELIVDSKVPGPVAQMMLRLHRDGPATVGLFRKSANSRMIKQVHDLLDSGQTVDFEELPPLAVGAVFKEWLRSLPDCLFPLGLYSDFVATNSIASEPARLQAVKDCLARLPKQHRDLVNLIIPLLRHISINDVENAMTPSNLAICIGQSMMWPARAEDILKNDVPPFVQFLIVNCEALFDAKDFFAVSPVQETIEEDVFDSDDGGDGDAGAAAGGGSAGAGAGACAAGADGAGAGAADNSASASLPLLLAAALVMLGVLLLTWSSCEAAGTAAAAAAAAAVADGMPSLKRARNDDDDDDNHNGHNNDNDDGSANGLNNHNNADSHSSSNDPDGHQHHHAHPPHLLHLGGGGGSGGGDDQGQLHHHHHLDDSHLHHPHPHQTQQLSSQQHPHQPQGTGAEEEGAGGDDDVRRKQILETIVQEQLQQLSQMPVMVPTVNNPGQQPQLLLLINPQQQQQQQQ